MQIELNKEMANCLRGAAEGRTNHRMALGMYEELAKEEEITDLAHKLADLLEHWG